METNENSTKKTIATVATVAAGICLAVDIMNNPGRVALYAAGYVGFNYLTNKRDARIAGEAK